MHVCFQIGLTIRVWWSDLSWIFWPYRPLNFKNLKHLVIWATRIIGIILRLNRTVTFMGSSYLTNYHPIMMNYKHFISYILNYLSIAHSHITKIWDPNLASTNCDLWDVKFLSIPHQTVIKPGYTKPHDSCDMSPIQDEDAVSTLTSLSKSAVISIDVNDVEFWDFFAFVIFFKILFS